MPVARRRHLRPGEERQVGARPAFGVRIEQVVGARVVLIDAALDEPHAENAGIEVEVLLRRAGDRGDVMKAVDSGFIFHLVIFHFHLAIWKMRV